MKKTLEKTSIKPTKSNRRINPTHTHVRTHVHLSDYKSKSHLYERRMGEGEDILDSEVERKSVIRFIVSPYVNGGRREGKNLGEGQKHTNIHIYSKTRLFYLLSCHRSHMDSL